jgi:hypothetical protein
MHPSVIVSVETHRQSQDPLPSDTLGQRLCEVFGRYRWSFIQAIAPTNAKTKPEWKTEKRYPIKSRVLWQQWQDAAQLIGVRFDDITVYALLDIDIGSPYHPHQNPKAAGGSARKQAPAAAEPKRLKPIVEKELQTKGEIMKCKAFSLEALLKEKHDPSAPRGVRGDQLSFPQAARPVLRQPSSSALPSSQQSVPVHYGSGIDAEQDEVIRAIQSQVRSLDWTIKEISEFIANRFAGKRRYQLSNDELLLLLYHLQNLEPTDRNR